MAISGINPSGTDPLGQKNFVDKAKQRDVDAPIKSRDGKDAKAVPNLDSKFLYNAAVGTVNYLLSDSEKPGVSGKREVTKAESREKTAVTYGAKMIQGGLMLSETGVGTFLIVAGVLLDVGAFAKGVREGHGTEIAKTAARELIHVPFAKYFKEAITT